MIKRIYTAAAAALMAAMLLLSGCAKTDGNIRAGTQENTAAAALAANDAAAAPDTPCTVLNNNIPLFSEDEITIESFEEYSELDVLGRCGTALACVGTDLMPAEERGAIGQIKPTGWHTVKYDCVDGKYLYNRCHLIGYQLSGENANERNLITGTRYLNIEGMLPFENEVADYVNETGNHVMYRVTPYFDGENLLADGVQMEAWSVEDEGDGICFNIFAYNIQPGILIDYATGESAEAADAAAWEAPAEETADAGDMQEYVLNTNTLKFHLLSCNAVEKIKEENKESFNGPRKWLIENGYEPCGNCKP